MLDDGVTRDSPGSAEVRRPPWWALVVAAPAADYLLAWGVDEAEGALRARAFGVPYFAGLRAPTPITGVHPSLALWLVGAGMVVGVVAALSSQRRARSTLLAALLVAPLGYGTARSAALWAAAPRASDLTVVPACRASQGDAPGVVRFDGASYEPEPIESLLLREVAARRDGGAIDLRVPERQARELAVASARASARTYENGRCGYWIVGRSGGDAISVARVEATFLWGELALSDHDADRREAIWRALTEGRAR